MQIWLEIFDAVGNRIGPGTVQLLTASVERRLDGIGSIGFAVPSTDQRVVEHLTNERRVIIYTDVQGEKREMGRGIIGGRNLSDNASRRNYNMSGPDILDELRRRNTLLNRQFENQDIATVATELADLVPALQISIEPNLGQVTARFDGATALKGFQKIAEKTGLHFRLSDDSSTIELGKFGVNNGVKVVGQSQSPSDMADNRDVLLIDSLRRFENSEQVVNRIIVLGGGEGLAQLDLSNSTRSIAAGFAFDIKTGTNPDGTTFTFLENEDSIAEFGVIESILVFKDISPLANSVTSKQIAANALYDAASPWLQRNSVIKTVYSFTARKPQTSIRPGDKITMRYKGRVKNEAGQEIDYVNINEELFVLRVSENASDGGLVLSFTVGIVDELPRDISDVIIGTIDSVNISGVTVQNFSTVFTDTWTEGMRSENVGGTGFIDAEFKFRPSSFINEIILVLLDFRTFAPWTMALVDSSSFTTYFFNMEKGTKFLTDIQLFINGVDVSAQFISGGLWNPSGVNALLNIQDLDITDILKAAPGGIFQEHTIVFHALEPGALRNKELSGHNAIQVRNSEGFVQLSLRIIATAQAILPS